MKDIRIGIITPRYFPNIMGGSEVSVKLLTEKLVKKGYETIVFAYDGRKNSIENINGVKVVRYKTFTKHFLSLTLLAYVANNMKQWENSVDIYHIYDVWPLPGAGLYKIFGGQKKVVATLNNLFGFCPISQAFGQCENCNFMKRVRCTFAHQLSIKAKIASLPYSCIYPLLTGLSQRVDQYIALSDFVKRIYVRFGFDAEKIEVIPNFAENWIVSRKAATQNETKHSFNILYVGRLSREKGVGILIKAFSEISQKSKHTHLFIVGNGPDMKHYTKMVDSLGIRDKVTFVGYVNNDELYKMYLIADVMVHPAIWPEPFGRTLLEAMSFGVPLIVSSAGAPPEIVENAGLVFESANVEDLKKTLELVLDNGELLNKMKRNCLRVLEKYDPEKVLNKIVKLYERILEK